MPSYLETCQSEFWKKVFKEELDYIEKGLKCCKNVLSVGCGPAIIERGLSEHGFEVTGLDVSEEAIEGAPDTIRTVIGSAEDMKFADASFDCCIFVASLQFIKDYKKAIEETARVLRPQGKLLVMLLNTESQYFIDNTMDSDSYMNRIKHRDNRLLTDAINKFFSVNTEYYLGITGEQIFPSNDPKEASLFVVKGIKR